jgi:hypothetical protein
MIRKSVGTAGLAALALLAAIWMGRTQLPGDPSEAPLATRAAASTPTEPSAPREEIAAKPRAAGMRSAKQVAALAPSGTLAPAPQAASRTRDTGSPRAEARQMRARGFESAEFDEVALIESGLAPEEVERLRTLLDEIDSERVDVLEQAETEGWHDKARYRNEMADLDHAARERIGDDDYDALLYGTGQANRVKVRAVLDNTHAPTFEFEPGDVVLTYDGQPIFRPHELRKTARGGEPGEWVTAEVLRGGQLVTLNGQRGEIRARLQPTRVAP